MLTHAHTPMPSCLVVLVWGDVEALLEVAVDRASVTRYSERPTMETSRYLNRGFSMPLCDWRLKRMMHVRGQVC